MSLPAVRALSLAVAACLACSASEPAGSSRRGSRATVVAHGDGWTLTAEDLSPRGDLATSAGRDPSRALDAAIARKLASNEARRRGLDRVPEIAAALDAVRREAAAREEALLRDALFASLGDALPLRDEEVRAQYEKTKALYTERRLALRRQTFASEAEARAADASLGPSGRLDPARAEALRPATPGNLARTVLPEALKLRHPGDRTLVLRDGGAALVELVDILPAEPLPFEAVKEKVEAILRLQRGQEAFRAEIARLRTEASVEVDEAALSQVGTLGATGASPAR